MANAFWGTVFRFDRAKIAPEIAIRNTIGIVLPLIAGLAAGNISAGVVGALGALNVSYSDSRDPYFARAQRMLMASVLVGVAVAAGALSGSGTAAAVFTASAWSFVVGMMVVLGPQAADLGTITLVTLLVFAARSLSATEAFESGLIAFCGGLLETILSIALWPVKPHQPERRIVAGLYFELSRVAVSPVGASAPPPASATLTSAQQALASLAGDHSIESERLVFLLNQAERIRLTLLTLRRLARRIERNPEGHAAATAVWRILSEASAALGSIADCIPQAKPTNGLKAFHDAVREFRKRDWTHATPMLSAMLRDAVRQTDALAGQLRAAAGLIEPPDASVAPAPALDRFSRIARLHANLSLRSTAFRHAVRLAVCVGIGDIIGRSLNIERSYWLPMTVAIVLKPDFTSTFSRGILRVAGTLIGLGAATAAVYFLPSSQGVEIVLLALFAFTLRWIGPANYGILVVGISGVVVLLIAMTGVDPKSAIVARALNTSAGGLFALAAYWIWPTWERTQAGPVIAAMLDSYRSHLHALMNSDLTLTDLTATRVAARLARSNAEASVGRFGAEPRVRPEQVNLLNEMLVSSHAFVRALMSIEAALGSQPKDRVREFSGKVERTLAAFADSLRTHTRLPDDLPDLRAAWAAQEQSAGGWSLLDAETDRIATSLNTLRDQIVKWNGTR